jgi:hypothetical protein
MHRCSASPAPIVKGDRYGEFQCPKNQYEIEQMKRVPYASALGSLQYAQVCTRPDLDFVTGLLGRFQSNPGPEHWKLIKKVLRYLQGTKDLMLTYRKTESLHIVGYSDSDYAGDDRKVVDDISRPLKLYCDNEPVVMYAHNNKSSGAAKHIDIKYYVVKDKVRDQTISLEHISTVKMLADPLMKGLPPSVFKEHVAGMGLKDSL